MRRATSLIGICLIAFLLSFAFAPTRVNAKVAESAFPETAFKLKTYEEIQRLPVEAQGRYLEGVRELVIELERMHQKNGAAGKQKAKELNAYLLILSNLIEEAQAAGRNDSRTVPSVRRSTGWFSGGRPQASCAGGLIATRLGGRDPSMFVCRRVAMVRTPCPSGFVAFRQTEMGYFFCASQASFNALDEGTKRAMRRPNPHTVAAGNLQNFRASGPNYTAAAPRAAAAAQPQRRVASGARSRRTEERSADARPRRANRDAEGAAASSEEVEAEESGSGIFQGVELDRSAAMTTADAAAATQAKVDGELTVEDENLRDEMINRCVEPSDANATCSDEVVEAARADFYRAGGPSCMYAGNLTFYSSARPEPGSCQAPREFCVGKASCRDQSGALVAGARPDLVCPNNSVICNPYIFSIQSNGKPFCVSKAENATEACNALTQAPATDGGAQRPYVDRMKNHFLFAAYKRSDRPEGIPEGYNAFVGQLNDMCFRNESAKRFFCRECEIIKRRSLYMNAASIKADCSGFEALGDSRGPSAAPQSNAPAASGAPAAQ